MIKSFVEKKFTFFKIKHRNNEIEYLIKNAYNSGNKLIQKAYLSEYEFRIRSNIEIRNFLADINSLENCKSFQNIVKLSIDHIKEELNYIKNLNQKLEIIRSDAEIYDEAIYPLIDNKMQLVLEGAKDVIIKHCDELLQGRLPKNYQISDQEMPFFVENNLTIYGTSKGTFLKAALVVIKNCISKENDNSWIDNSSIAHIVPIPECINIEEFENSKYYFSDEQTSKGLITIHSGYAFGGMREHKRYLYGRKYGPEDCSSWLAKLIDCKTEFSTIDLYKLFKINDDFDGKNEWLNSDIGKDLISKLKPIKLDDVRTGSIYAFRGFKDDPMMQGFGKGGHVGIVLGIYDKQIILLSNKREMPDVEGYITIMFPINDFYDDGSNIYSSSIGYKKVFYFNVVD